jgi:Sensors of blue-light using FAD
MERVVYVSRRRNDTDSAGYSSVFDEIGEKAARNNAARGLTGFLLCTPTWFAQVLEGEASTIAALLDRLKQDVRHFDLRVLDQQACQTRQFPLWGMGWRHQTISNRIVFLTHGLVQEAPPHVSQAQAILRVCHDLAGDVDDAANPPSENRIAG